MFTDDYNKVSWVYFLKLKSETFDNFKYFKALVEKQSAFPLTTLRSDPGGEFTYSLYFVREMESIGS